MNVFFLSYKMSAGEKIFKSGPCKGPLPSEDEITGQNAYYIQEKLILDYKKYSISITVFGSQNDEIVLNIVRYNRELANYIELISDSDGKWTLIHEFINTKIDVSTITEIIEYVQKNY